MCQSYEHEHELIGNLNILAYIFDRCESSSSFCYSILGRYDVLSR